MNKAFKLFLPLLVVLCKAGVICAKDLNIGISPGDLCGRGEEISASGAERIVIHGVADVRDLKVLARSLPPSLKELDLGDLSITSYTYPASSREEHGDYMAGEIPPALFAFSGMTKFVWPRYVSRIGEGAFAGSNIEEITLPSDIAFIDDYAFAGCQRLTSVRFSGNVGKLGKGVFEGCGSLIAADMSLSNIGSLPVRTFAGCTSLVSLNLPSRIAHIGTEALAGAPLSEISVGYTTRLDPYALASVPGLETVDLNSAPTSEGLLFGNGSLREIRNIGGEIPPNLAVGTALCQRNQLLYVSDIYDHSFAGIPVDTLNLGKGLKSVGSGVFHSAPKLKAIYAAVLLGEIPATNDDAFDGLDQPSISLFVADDCLQIWKDHPQWGKFDVKPAGALGADIVNAAGRGSVSISLENGMLGVSSAHAIVSVSVWTPSGSLLMKATPWSMEWSADMSGMGADVIVVSAKDKAGNLSTAKFLLD